MNTNNQTCINPIEEQRAEALRHYEEISSQACHWSSFVEAAIKAYNPEQKIPESVTEEDKSFYRDMGMLMCTGMGEVAAIIMKAKAHKIVNKMLGDKKPDTVDDSGMKFKVGDVVRHKAGGLPMTVDGYRGFKEVKCIWFNKTKLHRGLFNESCLTADTVVEDKEAMSADWRLQHLSIKPPLGLMPEYIWKEQRIWDIEEAILRYRAAFKEIPQEWIDEKYELSKSLKPEPTDNNTKEREWEIVSFQEWYIYHPACKPKEKGYIYPVINGMVGCFSNAMSVSEWLKTQPPIYTIHSVRRLSDGEVFTVGEKFSNNAAKDYTEEIIKSFEIWDNHIKVRTGDGEDLSYYLLGDIDKIKQTTEKVSTNNDGVVCLSLNDILPIVRGLSDQTKGYDNKKYLNQVLHEVVNQKLKQ